MKSLKESNKLNIKFNINENRLKTTSNDINVMNVQVFSYSTCALRSNNLVFYHFPYFKATRKFKMHE